MEYGKIIAVTGLPGLFELLSSKNDGAIVRSLEDQSTKFVSSRVHNFSHLESIEVFTVKDNVNLKEIFDAIDNEGGKIPDGKDAAALKAYFLKVYPDLDFERVYSSDLKKMAKWYEILKEKQVEIKLTQPEPEENDSDSQEANSSEAEAAVSEAPEEIETPKAKKQKTAAKNESVKEAEKPPVKKTSEKDDAPAKSKASSSKGKTGEAKEKSPTAKAGEKETPKKKSADKSAAAKPAAEKKAAPKKKS